MDYSLTPIIFDRYACRNFEKSSKLEWVEANDTGAYAMGTVAGVNTRRYHGLLVASMHAPVQRRVTVAKVDETVGIGAKTYEISTNQYPGAVHPSGFDLLEVFRLDPFPQWTWQLGSDTFTKEIFLIKGRQAAAIVYSATADCTIRARPFLACRPYHNLIHASRPVDNAVKQAADFVALKPFEDDGTVIYLHHNAMDFRADGLWYRNFEYLEEMERGMDYLEDLYTPGELVFDLKAGERSYAVFTITGGEQYDYAALSKVMDDKRTRPIVAKTPFETKLTAASEQFRACRADGRPTIMAGFPWFADWGRDTMISLPGLILTRGLLDDGPKIIESFLIHLNRGIIPNHYPDFGTPQYNTCDATLWMFQAVWSYMQCGGNLSWIERVFYPAVKEILGWHLRGTMYEIKVDPEDGLLSAGVKGTQLTWMDAKVGDWVVTPRHGKPVEVDALWYNALRMTVHWAVEFGDMEFAQTLTPMADLAQKSFVEKFWNANLNCLYDVLGPDGPVAKVRPNQLFAISLPFDLFDRDRQRAIVAICEKELLTPVGLRTLSPSDPDYRPRYIGDRVSRDGAYHQGTVWPWLLGPFITAYLKVNGHSEEAVSYCRKIVEGMEPQILATGLGSICEIYDGDAPHHPRGCIAQAWSVAELLRVMRSDLR